MVLILICYLFKSNNNQIAFELMIASYQDVDILRKIGIKVHHSQVSQTMTLLLSDPDFAKQIDKIKASMTTMINEDHFIDCIVASHKNISEIPENSKVIQNRDNTFSIRAINPENIKSLTERAFFNSFNLERNVLNDLEQQILLHKNNSYRPKQGKERFCNENNQNRGRTQNDEQQKCICNKNIPGSNWIQCNNQQKCRGSNWYHLECAGVENKDLENLSQINFICQLCKREEMEDESANQVRKRPKQQQIDK